jgi:O-antigen polymerase
MLTTHEFKSNPDNDGILQTQKVRSVQPIMLLPLLIFGIALLVLPHFFSGRMAAGIFKTDFYLIWITGCACWIFNVFYLSLEWGRIARIEALIVLYILVMSCLRSSPDENSFYALITLLALMGIVRYLSSIMHTALYPWVFLLMPIAILSQSFIAIRQVLSGAEDSLSIRAGLYNSGFFANYLSCIIPLCMAALVSKSATGKFLRVISFTLLAGSIGLLYLTLARAAWIGVAIGIMITIIITIKKISAKQWAAIGLACLFLILAGILILYKIKPDSANGRFTIYNVSIDMIKQQPFTGVGPNRFAAVYNLYQSAYFSKTNTSVETRLIADDTFEAFNSIIQIFAEYGIIGLILIGYLLFSLLRHKQPYSILPTSRWLYNGSMGCIVTVFTSSLFSNPFHVLPILLLLTIPLAAILPGNTPLRVTGKKNKKIRVFALIITILLCAYMVIRHKAESVWYKAATVSKYEGFAKAKDMYASVASVFAYNGDFLFNYGAESTIAGNHDIAVLSLEKAKRYNAISNLYIFLGDAYTAQKNFTLAEQHYLTAIYIVPSHLYPKYQLISMYKSWGKKQEEAGWKERALQFPIKIPSALTNELLLNLRQNNY